jgi:hypothetical protein
MRLKTLAAVAALSLVAAPVVAAPVSPAAQQAGENVRDAGGLEGTTAWILAAIGLGLIIWGIIELTAGDEGPSSP